MCWSLPTTQRCKIASAGNGDFNTSRIYGQLSRGGFKGLKSLSQQQSNRTVALYQRHQCGGDQPACGMPRALLRGHWWRRRQGQAWRGPPQPLTGAPTQAASWVASPGALPATSPSCPSCCGSRSRKLERGGSDARLWLSCLPAAPFTPEGATWARDHSLRDGYCRGGLQRLSLCH